MALSEELHQLSILDSALDLLAEILIVSYFEALPVAKRGKHKSPPIYCLREFDLVHLLTSSWRKSPVFGDEHATLIPISDHFSGSKHLDVPAAGLRLREQLSFLAQAFKVKLDRFLDQPKRFGLRLADRNAAGQIRHVGAVAAISLFQNDYVFHHPLSIISFQPSLFHDAIQRSRRHVQVRFA